jgi:tRNA(Arg) A34 adenosine deaminase TadA
MVAGRALWPLELIIEGDGMTDDELLEEARQEALKLPKVRGQQRVVAMAYDKRDNLLATGVNSYVKTHPRQKYFAELAGNPEREYLHAEIHALIKAKARWGVHKLVIARVAANGQLLPSTPCPVCELAIEEAKVEHLIYYHSQED